MGVREKITERLIAGTLEGSQRLLYTVYYLRQRVGSRNADRRRIPEDKLTHIHNRPKSRHYDRHHMLHIYRVGIGRDGKLFVCITQTKQNTLKFQNITRELRHHAYNNV